MDLTGLLIIVMMNGSVIFNQDMPSIKECRLVARQLRESSQVSDAFCLDYKEEGNEPDPKIVRD